MNGVVFPFSPFLIPEIIRTFLEHRADVWFVWMLVATVALFAGILLEERVERIIVMRYQISDDGSILEDEERARWQERLRTIGFWLAVVSIVGEGVCEFMGARAEGRVREFANTRVLMAQQEAVLAAEVAAEANARTLREIEARLVLEKELKDEAAARDAVAKAVAWRKPKRGLIKSLTGSLSKFSGQKFIIVFDAAEPERFNVFSWINLLLGTSGWNLEPIPSRGELKVPLTNVGLWITPNAPDKVIAAARALGKALDAGGLPSKLFQIPFGPLPDTSPPELIRIVVYPKGPVMNVEVRPRCQRVTPPQA